MDKAWEGGVRLQKRIAMGDKDPLDVGNYGVDSLSSHSAGGPASGKTDGKYLKDDERAARSPIDGNQANPDHGY